MLLALRITLFKMDQKMKMLKGLYLSYFTHYLNSFSIKILILMIFLTIIHKTLCNPLLFKSYSTLFLSVSSLINLSYLNYSNFLCSSFFFSFLIRFFSFLSAFFCFFLSFLFFLCFSFSDSDSLFYSFSLLF